MIVKIFIGLNSQACLENIWFDDDKIECISVSVVEFVGVGLDHTGILYPTCQTLAVKTIEWEVS